MRASLRAVTHGFTLVELVAVIAIISVLIGIVVTTGGNARKRARINQARAEIAALETAIQAYRTDVGVFPSTAADSTIDTAVVRLLSGLESSGGAIQNPPADWNGPYMEFDRARLDAGAAFLDPWANPYRARWSSGDPNNPTPNLVNVYSFDLWSIGPDETDQGGGSGSDDITNF